MIVIDTNVVAEMMRDEPDPTRVGRHGGAPHTTAITLAEIEYGIARFPDGRRKDSV